MGLKNFFRKNQDMLTGCAVIVLLYTAQAWLRPLAVPGEYNFIVLLQKYVPEYPDIPVLLRLPAMLATLLSGWLFFAIAKLRDFKRPGILAAFYLLLPPVFYAGTAASAVPLLAAGVLLALLGLQKASMSDRLWGRAKAVFAALPGVLVTGMYATSVFCRKEDFLMLIPVAAVFLIGIISDWIERKDKERTRRILNRVIIICSAALCMLGVMIMIPQILRHFKVDFPAGLAFYHAGERIYRPMLMLLLPLVWLYLARDANKIGRKLFLMLGALGFLTFVLPLTLPWKIQRDLYAGYTFEKLSGEISRTDTVCFVMEKDSAFFRKYFKLPVRIIGENGFSSGSAGLNKELGEVLKKHNAVVVCTGQSMGLIRSEFPGKRYVVGKYTIFYYYRNGVEK